MRASAHDPDDGEAMLFKDWIETMQLTPEEDEYLRVGAVEINLVSEDTAPEFEAMSEGSACKHEVSLSENAPHVREYVWTQTDQRVW